MNSWNDHVKGEEHHYSGKQGVLCLELGCEECKHPMTSVQNPGGFPISYMDVKETWSSTFSCYSVQTTVVHQLQMKSDQQENAQLSLDFWYLYLRLKPSQYACLYHNAEQ